MKPPHLVLVEPDLHRRLRHLGRAVDLRPFDAFHLLADTDTITIVLSGALDCVMLSPSAQEFIVQRTGTADIICNIAGPSEACCDRTYIAVEDSSVVTLSYSRFVQVASEDLRVADLLIRSFARQVESCYTRVYELCFLPANARIYWYLLRCSRSTTDWFPLDTHQMIANQLAVSRETVSREIGGLIECGLAERRDRALRVIDIQQLTSRVRRLFRYQSRLLDS